MTEIDESTNLRIDELDWTIARSLRFFNSSIRKFVNSSIPEVAL